ncbi:MAG: hypothetical protein A2W36_06900 [Chloroflexi bacterium RBG_16_58_14]|nr:MAG: hypothetical protein A2W36_06900 [Chloroflexi bacterium RBG_16_58_14]
MVKSRLFNLARLLLLAALLLVPLGNVLAQTYSFNIDRETVDVYWNTDGSLAIDYVFVFSNDAFASPIDYVDVGVPTENFDLSSVSADVDGQTIFDITESPYVQPGIALGLGSDSIQPGQTGTVRVFIGRVERVLHLDTQDDQYASAVFSPTWFDSKFVHGSTDLTVAFHLPPGVQPEEPRWHSAPSGFPSEPATALDGDGRVTYTWRNPSASGSVQYEFGASFPEKYVPAEAIIRPNPFAWVSAVVIPLVCIGMIVLLIYWVIAADRQRKLRYLPPKIAIEGHGIKRGLTAVEAAILMEQPMDKILTMLLFSVIKKNAAQVTSRDPLEIERLEPIPPDLHAYEGTFLAAFAGEKGAARRKALQKGMVDLVRSVGEKMRGFSRRESVAYYKNIIDRAWEQVSAAGTPEVKSEKYAEVMEWTMLDREYEGRTREVLGPGPVFVPVWWPRYDPGFGRGVQGTSGAPVLTGAPGGGAAPSLPHLPGSDFAASMVKGVQSFSTGVVGNLTEFTSGITGVTNPPPKPSTSTSSRSGSRGGGGSSCACACACAGCACACAGGGR